MNIIRIDTQPAETMDIINPCCRGFKFITQIQLDRGLARGCNADYVPHKLWQDLHILLTFYAVKRRIELI